MWIRNSGFAYCWKCWGTERKNWCLREWLFSEIEFLCHVFLRRIYNVLRGLQFLCHWLVFFSNWPVESSVRPSVPTYVWCEYESDYNNLRSASASDSGGDSVVIKSALILSIVPSIRVLQQYTSEAETRTQDQMQRSNAQTVTLKTKRCRLNL